jgi:hypothetical protein
MKTVIPIDYRTDFPVGPLLAPTHASKRKLYRKISPLISAISHPPKPFLMNDLRQDKSSGEKLRFLT